MIDKMNELEKAAMEAAEDCYECSYDNNHTGMNLVKEAFMYGAEWNKNQSPCISVEERLPDIVSKDGESDYVLVRYKDFIPEVAKYCTDEYHECPSFKAGGKKHVSHWIGTNFDWIRNEITHWMPIPPIK